MSDDDDDDSLIDAWIDAWIDGWLYVAMCVDGEEGEL